MRYQAFYERHQLKMQLEDGVPIPMGISSFCNYGDKNCHQECNLNGDQCPKFEPNHTFNIWKTIEGEDIISIDEIDDY